MSYTPLAVLFFVFACGSRSATPPEAAVEAAGAMKEAAAPEPTTASVTFTNSCTDTIWLAEFGNGAAQTCTTDDDCHGGTCKNNSCEQVLCTAATDCGDLQFCDAATCSTDGQCPAGAPCKADGDCTAIPGQTCDTTIGQCTPTCDASSSACMCATSADCPANGQCVDNRCTGGLCRYELTPSPGYWELGAGATQELSIPIGWGGRFWARTGCPDALDSCSPVYTSCTADSDCCNNSCTGPSGAMICTPGIPACETGDCQASAACDLASAAPVALFEVFFQETTTTWFDGSLVDGINVPLAVEALDESGDPLAGCAPANVAGCSQTLDTSGLSALRVASTTTCSTDSDCGFLGECVSGACTAGYSAPCDACGSASPPDALDCDDNRDLYCCTGANAPTCNGGNPVCMGDSDCPSPATCNADHVCTPVVVTCSQDSDCAANYACVPSLSSDPSSPKTCLPNATLAATCCGPTNPSWRTVVQPLVEPFKDACPNAYSFQFDDPSSNTACNGTAASFEVTFCPSLGN